MKKILMIATLSIVVAFTTKAASISWANAAASAILGLDGSTAMTSVNATDWNFTIYLVNQTDAVANIGTLSSISTKSAGVLTGASINATYGTLWSNADVFTAVATMSKDGTDYKMNINAGVWKITAADDTGKDVFSWGAGIYGGTGVSGNNVWIAEVVPEPTSMALLALGVAAVGLRRRFMK